MLCFYLITAAVMIPVLDNFVNILHHQNSWIYCPLLFLGIFIALILLHYAVAVISIRMIRLDSNPDKHAGYFRKLVNLSVPMFFKLALVKIHTSGFEKIPEDTRFLLVSNHIDDFDPVVIMSVLPEAELGFVGKKEIFEKMPIVARAMHKLHGLPIDRENNREAVKTIVKAAEIIKEDKASIGIFPEGYSSKTGELLPMRNGAFKIAYKAKVPIVVSVIGGTRALKKNIFRRKTDVYYDVLHTFTAKELENISSNELGEKVTELMQEGIKRIKEKQGKQ